MNVDELLFGKLKIRKWILNKPYIVMISSSVNGYEDQLLQIESLFISLGYRVVMSMSGTLKVNPHLHNFDNCLKAVEDCDVFFGIIRPDCGTGRAGDECVTFQEFKHARKLNKPCWYVIDNKIKIYKNLLKALILREYPNTKDEDLNAAITSYYNRQIREREHLPRVLDFFESKDLRQFDPQCFDMEDFVNHKGMPREKVSNNWMQYCNNLLEIATFIRTDFEDKNFIDSIVKNLDYGK